MLFKITINLKCVKKCSTNESTADKFFQEHPDVPMAYEDLGEDVLIHFSDDKCIKAKFDVYTFTCTLTFDDFDPDLFLSHGPWWIEKIEDVVKKVEGEAFYGDKQGVRVSERLEHGDARAIIRHVVTSSGAYAMHVKIVARGSYAIQNACTLHQQILEQTI